MLREFARLVAEIFPSIEPGTARAYLDSIQKDWPLWSDLYATQLPPRICQGDILDGMTFIVQDDEGDFGELTAPGFLLSHSCDVESDDNVLFAACRSLALFREHRALSDIRNNTFFSTIYLEDVPEIGSVVVDLSIVQSVRRSVLERNLRNATVRRVSSFTDFGYYFFIAKLTVQLLRPQAEDEIRNRSVPGLPERLRSFSRALLGLIRYVVYGRN